MDIGTGIAIAGVWVFAAVVGVSKQTTEVGFFIGIFVAIGITVYLK